MKRIKPSCVAKELDVNKATIYRWIKEGKLPEPRKLLDDGELYWLFEDLEGIKELAGLKNEQD